MGVHPLGVQPPGGPAPWGSSPVGVQPPGGPPRGGPAPWGSSPVGVQPVGVHPVGVQPPGGLAPWGSSPVGVQPSGGPAQWGSTPWGSSPLGVQPPGGPAPWGSSPVRRASGPGTLGLTVFSWGKMSGWMMLSWVWIFRLRTLWAVWTCSFRTRCCVELGNLQTDHTGTRGVQVPVSLRSSETPGPTQRVEVGL